MQTVPTTRKPPVKLKHPSPSGPAHVLHAQQHAAQSLVWVASIFRCRRIFRAMLLAAASLWLRHSNHRVPANLGLTHHCSTCIELSSIKQSKARIQVFYAHVVHMQSEQI